MLLKFCLLLSLLGLGAADGPFRWSTLEQRLQEMADSLLNPNLRALYELQRALGTTADCSEALSAVVLGLRNRRRWAVEMADASGKVPGGILEGTVMAFGSLDECLRVRLNDSRGEVFRGRYCLVGYQSPLLAPLHSGYVQAHGEPPEWARDILDRAEGYLKRVAFWFGTCVPSSCTQEDVRRIAAHVSRPLGFNVTVRDCQVDEPFVWPTSSLAALCVLGCLCALCAVGTSMDVVCRWRKTHHDNVLVRAALSFSVLANSEALFRGGASGGCLSCLGGMRFLSATWIVLGHTYFYTDTWKYLKYRRLLGFADQFDGFLPVAVIENFTVPVGSFFFMSGFLLVYTTWRLLVKSEGKLNLLMFFVHKFWRMTPGLGLTLALFFCLPLIDSGPIWNSTLNPPLEQCRKFWWTNLLYINNWWNTDQFCLLHSWYLAALMQFHAVGILLLLVVYRWPVVGTLLGSAIAVSCVAVTTLLVVWHDFPMPALGIVKDMDVIEDYNSRIYVKPFTHFPTYLSGMVLAHVLLKYPNRKIGPKYQLAGWALAALCAASSVYGLYGPAQGIALRALYIVGHRIGWALGIGWMIYACATGNGGAVNRLLSWSALGPLGQLSYLTYLLHPLVIIYRNAALRERVYYGHTELVFSFLSTLVVSHFLAYVGYVAVETPFAKLEKMIFAKKSKVECKEDPQLVVKAIDT